VFILDDFIEEIEVEGEVTRADSRL
jgi:hypothetical protein